MPATTVPTVEDALLARFTAAISPVRVTLGVPPEKRPREGLYILDVTNHTRQVVAQQELASETYTVPMQLEVQTYGQDRAAARDRMWNLIGLMLADIAGEPRVSGVAQSIELASVPQVSIHGESDGWQALADISFEVTAYV